LIHIAENISVFNINGCAHFEIDKDNGTVRGVIDEFEAGWEDYSQIHGIL